MTRYRWAAHDLTRLRRLVARSGPYDLASGPMTFAMRSMRSPNAYCCDAIGEPATRETAGAGAVGWPASGDSTVDPVREPAQGVNIYRPLHAARCGKKVGAREHMAAEEIAPERWTLAQGRRIRQ